MSTKQELNVAFAELRKKGWFARQNFACCQSCGWSGVPEDRTEKAVFYHRQDMERMKETGELFLAHSGPAREIVDVLEKHGFEVEWDGSENTRISLSVDVKSMQKKKSYAHLNRGTFRLAPLKKRKTMKTKGGWDVEI